jgi:hypothetical protein
LARVRFHSAQMCLSTNDHCAGAQPWSLGTSIDRWNGVPEKEDGKVFQSVDWTCPPKRTRTVHLNSLGYRVLTSVSATVG